MKGWVLLWVLGGPQWVPKGSWWVLTSPCPPPQLWQELCELLSQHPDRVRSLDAGAIIRGGLTRFTDQLGRLWGALADCYIRSGHFEKVTQPPLPSPPPTPGATPTLGFCSPDHPGAAMTLVPHCRATIMAVPRPSGGRHSPCLHFQNVTRATTTPVPTSGPPQLSFLVPRPSQGHHSPCPQPPKPPQCHQHHSSLSLM